MQDHDPSKKPSISLSPGKPSKPSPRRRQAPKANVKETREILGLTLLHLHEATVRCRALEQRLRDVLAENRELRAALADKSGGR